MKATITALILLCALSTGHAITLDSCLQRAYTMHRYDEQRMITDRITTAKVSEQDRTYLPSVELNGMSTYQNAQISIPVGVNIPGFESPTVPLNLNSALFTIRQWIYDGNTMASKQAIEKASGQVALIEIEVQRLQTKTAVMQQYFTVLLSKQQESILREKEQVLQERLKEVESAVKHGALLQSDADMLRAELLKVEQQFVDLHYVRKEAITSLSVLTGLNIQETEEFVIPRTEITTDLSMAARPDLMLLDRKRDLIETQKDAISAQYLPRIGLFADLGAGYPGYDIFDKNVAPMARVGLTLNWKLFDWDRSGYQQEALDLSAQVIDLQKERIKTQSTVQAQAQRTAIEKMEELMRTDERLVELYRSVTTTYASQLKNGAITSSAYITELSKLQSAQVDLELHKMQRRIAIMNYNTILGQ